MYEPGQSLVLRPHQTSKQNTKETARKAVYVCPYIWILAHPLNIPVIYPRFDLHLRPPSDSRPECPYSSPSFSWAHVDGRLQLWTALDASTPHLPRGRVHSMAQEDWTSKCRAELPSSCPTCPSSYTPHDWGSGDTPTHGLANNRFFVLLRLPGLQPPDVSKVAGLPALSLFLS